MGPIGFPEMVIILVIALVVFGPRKLPELGRSLGRSLNEFKKASNELRSTLEDEIRIEELPYHCGTEIRFHLRARSFLHNQVRSIVGTLERVGAEGWSPEEVRDALAARDRAACGPVCPPQGLYLTGVGYPVDPFAG